MPNRITPPTPAATASAAAFLTLSLVCWRTPGMEGTGCGSLMPSFTNSGRTRSEATHLDRRDQPTHRRGPTQPTWSRRRKRGERKLAVTTIPRFLIRRPPPGGAHSPCGSSSPDSSPSPDPGTELTERLHQGGDRGLVGHDVDAQAELLGGLGGLRTDTRDHGDGVRLAGDADQVAHRRGRGEQHRVEAAALDRLADLGRRRRRPHGPVGGDVVDLPAQLRSARPAGSRWRCRRAAAGPGRSGRSTSS